MSHNDNTAAQMLLFPIQRREVNEYTSITDEILEARLEITEGLNKVATGKVTLTDAQKEDWGRRINLANEVFIKYGFSPIYLDF